MIPVANRKSMKISASKIIHYTVAANHSYYIIYSCMAVSVTKLHTLISDVSAIGYQLVALFLLKYL